MQFRLNRQKALGIDSILLEGKNKMLKKLVKSILPIWAIRELVNIKNNYFDGYALKSYSQEGEDMILRRLFEKLQKKTTDRFLC